MTSHPTTIAERAAAMRLAERERLERAERAQSERQAAWERAQSEREALLARREANETGPRQNVSADRGAAYRPDSAPTTSRERRAEKNRKRAIAFQLRQNGHAVPVDCQPWQRDESGDWRTPRAPSPANERNARRARDIARSDRARDRRDRPALKLMRAFERAQEEHQRHGSARTFAALQAARAALLASRDSR